MKLFLITLLFLPVVVFASGGKVNNPWQPIDPDVDVCTAFLPEGLDLTDCQETASTTSGISYLCSVLEDFIVYCPETEFGDDDDDDDDD